MSSSPLYTLTKERSLPSPVYRCCLRSGYSAARFPRVSPAVPPPTSTSELPFVYCLKGVGILTFGIEVSFSSRLSEYDRLFVVVRAVVLEHPRAHVIDLVLAHGGDDVRVVRPGVLPVVLGGLGRVIRVRMVEPQEIHVQLPRPLLEPLYLQRLDEEAMPPVLVVGILCPPDVYHDLHLARVHPDEGAGALFGVGLFCVVVDVPHVPRPDLERHYSSQKLSERYLSAP